MPNSDSAARPRVTKSVMGVPPEEIDRYGNRVLRESVFPLHPREFAFIVLVTQWPWLVLLGLAIWWLT